MGSFFTLIMLILIMIFGLLELSVGVTGLIIGIKKRKTKKVLSRVFLIVSPIIMVLSIITLYFPSSFFGFIITINSTPPESFVETEIQIEENKYQDTVFTADGIVYEALYLELYNNDIPKKPIFHYKPEGFLNKREWGNYYLVENENGFTLISDEMGRLFSPIDEKEVILNYYSNINNYSGYYYDWEESYIKLSDNQFDLIIDFVSNESHIKETKRFNEYDDFSIQYVSNDNIVLIGNDWFIVNDDVIYYVYNSVVNFGYEEFILVELPKDVGEEIYSYLK